VGREGLCVLLVSSSFAVLSVERERPAGAVYAFPKRGSRLWSHPAEIAAVVEPVLLEAAQQTLESGDALKPGEVPIVSEGRVVREPGLRGPLEDVDRPIHLPKDRRC